MRLRDLIAFAIHCGDWGAEPKDITEQFKTWITIWLPALAEDHFGNCTKDPGPCSRCLAEEWYEMADEIVKYADLTDSESVV